MEPFDDDDYERPIESYPGYIGHLWDYDFFPGPELAVLSDFDWSEYSELVEDAGGTRSLNINPKGEVLTLVFEADELAGLIGQLSAVDVHKDDGPSDQGLAGGSGTIFILKDGATEAELSQQATELRRALDADLAQLASHDAP